ncbi:MAG TPA: PIN domain-containing protein [Verrucomicrobiae bacterium]|jgi:predicted nucleic acid-binding protein
MPKLVDSSVWIDLVRPKSPKALKEFIQALIDDPEVVIAEPIIFEVLVYASEDEGRNARRTFELFDILKTPADLWIEAVHLGQRCRAEAITPGPLDTIIAALAIHHEAELVTFDSGFKRIAAVSPLKANIVVRPH